jgi:hypothetical protein
MSAMSLRLGAALAVFAIVASLGAGAAALLPESEPIAKAPTEAKTRPSDDKATARAPRPSVPLVGGPVGPDDLALRYYASLKQTARVDAELARLQKLYPAYQPPADLYDAPAGGGPDEQPFWALYAADRIDELKAALAAKERETPGWKPSADLASKVRRKELRLRINALWKSEKFYDLVDFIKGEDLGELSEEVDVLWTVAEAYARAKQSGDALDMFRRILTTSKEPHIRVATIQKALGALRMSDVEKLLAAAPGAAEGQGEYREIAIDLTRARIAAFLHDERAEEVPVADVQKFEAYARESRDANQMGLVAWYDYKRRDFAAALEWFKLAIESDGDAMIAHGLAHSLRALGMFREAEEVAYAWREPLVNNVILFLDLLETDLTREVPPYIEAERLARYAKATIEAGSGEGAQALAWYAYNSCQFDVALFWFERAVAWFPKEATVYGYALTLRRLRKAQGLYELANRYDGLFAKVIEILFPDGYYHPPTPCDRRGAEKMHGAPLRTAAFVAPGPATIPGAAPNYELQQAPYAAQKNATSPLDAQQLRQDDARLQRILKSLASKFPAAVPMQNPLRFRPLSIAALVAQRAPAQAFPSAADGPLRSDPATPPASLVARRVPGVGPMPYEKYGFSLLPGWNGVETATWPPFSKQIAPAGTQWADQDADPVKAGLAVFDVRNPANARGLPPGAQPVVGYGQRPLAVPGQAPSAGVFAAPGPREAPPPAPPQPAPPAYGQYPQPVSR